MHGMAETPLTTSYMRPVVSKQKPCVSASPFISKFSERRATYGGPAEMSMGSVRPVPHPILRFNEIFKSL